MQWLRPEFVEIKMDAEISGYQSEFDPPNGSKDPVAPREPKIEAGADR
jgi:hypothetical protein